MSRSMVNDKERFHCDSTHQREQTLRLANGSAVAEEAEHKHETANCYEDVDALVDELRLGESLLGEKKFMKNSKTHQ